MFCFLSLTAFTPSASAAENLSEPVSGAESGEAAAAAAQPVPEEPTFEIREFQLQGNTIYPTPRLLEILDDVTGEGRTAADVERGRDLLERFYHEEGYPTVLVNIPEQSAEGGSIRLQVIESRIGSAKVSGNRYFSTQRILERLPSLAPGTILHVPEVQQEVARVNRTPDLKVTPAMSPGKQLGTVDVELKARDRSPWHGSLELNNRNSNNTKPLRLNAALRYDNLWNREHSLSLQYQTAPQQLDQVQVFSGSYSLPAPWHQDQTLVLYGVVSDSNTAFGEGFETQGKGTIVGGRASIPLTPYGAYSHSALLGLDYKDFQESTGIAGSSEGEITTPVQYLPLSFAYSGVLPDDGGLTLFSAGLNLSFRGLVSRQEDFRDKRFKARGNYLVATLGAERRQRLPAGLGFLLKLDGQIADQPLIANEQFAAGGMGSVRGYRESERLGDNGFHATLELASPDLAPVLKLGERFRMAPYLFYDCALLWVKEPLAGQESFMELQGAGLGLRGFMFADLEYQLDWGFALSDSTSVRAGDNLLHFKVKYQF